MMMRENIPGVARPVRIVANSSLANSIARSIFSSASKRVSSITASPPRLASGGGLRGVVGGHRGDQGADLLATDGPDDGVFALGTEDQHRQAVFLAQAERGGVDHLEAPAEGLIEGNAVQLAGARISARIGGVD